eukprot:m.22332 g.22332  ORF g.22332 m.22332 type:complete len:488 (+) comp7388_c0_seq2:183-1646(+)
MAHRSLRAFLLGKRASSAACMRYTHWSNTCSGINNVNSLVSGAHVPRLRYESKRPLTKVILKPNDANKSNNVKTPKQRDAGEGLAEHLKARIQILGPMAVADYVREVLTNPNAGYYTRKSEIFGTSGDFITSPEISQMFGELVAVWFVAQVQLANSPKNLHLVEIGPGKGTMMADMLRSFSTFSSTQSLSVSMVDASSKMWEVQKQTLRDAKVKFKNSEQESGMDIKWFSRLEDVPLHKDSYQMIVCHEFFDALPIHQFEVQDGKWRERLVFLNNQISADGKEIAENFTFGIAEEVTGAQQVSDSLGLLPNPTELPNGTCREVCLDSWRVCHEISQRLRSDVGGSALVIDYGDKVVRGDTLRAFRKHKEVNLFDAPGSADVTADVNFNDLRKAFTAKKANDPENKDNRKINVFGPITQQQFLYGMGIRERAEMLCKNADFRRSNTIKTQVTTLTEEMGERFKFMAVTTASKDATETPRALLFDGKGL